jgi:L-rhamnose mutarotase
MERVCFTLRLKADRLDEYIERHQNVWPEMQAALRETGWGNYSLFLAPNGLLIGYLETESFDEARSRMKALPVNARWQAEMARFFESTGESADDSMRPLQELFHLD